MTDLPAVAAYREAEGRWGKRYSEDGITSVADGMKELADAAVAALEERYKSDETIIATLRDMEADAIERAEKAEREVERLRRTMRLLTDCENCTVPEEDRSCQSCRDYVPDAVTKMEAEVERLKEERLCFQFQCPYCYHWRPWTDGTDDEYWCQVCGTESKVTHLRVRYLPPPPAEEAHGD